MPQESGRPLSDSTARSIGVQDDSVDLHFLVLKQVGSDPPLFSSFATCGAKVRGAIVHCCVKLQQAKVQEFLPEWTISASSGRGDT